MTKLTTRLIVLIILLHACQTPDSWKNTIMYPSGKVKLAESYMIENGDTIVTAQKVYHENGQMYMFGNIVDHERNGVWKTFYDDGTPWSETAFKNGVTDGPTKTWYKNGKIRFTGFFKDGEKSGTWYWYDEKGNLNKKIELGE
jgi:antitoxin component YwqK of YwqJK toxin-antitoxin module